MAEVRSTLELDVAAALAEVDSLGAALTDALTSAADAGSQAIADSVGATGPATAGVQELGNASAVAAEQQSGLRDSIEGVAGVSLLATGQVGGMRTAVQGFGVDAIPAVAGGLALAGAVRELFQAGVAATAAQQRFNVTLGDMAARISTINVGSLNADLKELSISLGSDDEAVMNAAATLFQFATNAGVARGEAADFTEEVIALAARAVALNPALGTIADVIPLMSRGLATGGRFAQRFGLDLDGTEISARALADRLPGVSGELSVTEKQLAGAAIATERYGAALEGDIKTGTENAIIQQRSLHEQLQNVIEELGKPLVTPIFDLMREALPAVEALGRVLSELGQAAVPLLTVALQAVTPLLTALADAMTAIGPTALTIVVAFLSLSKIAYGLGFALGALQKAATANPLLALAAVAVTIGSALGLFGDSAEDAATDVTNLGKASNTALRELADAQALAITATTVGADATTNARLQEKARQEVLVTLNAALEQNEATGRRYGQALVEAGAITEGQFTRAVRDASTAQQNLATDNRNSADSIVAFIDTVVGTMPALGSTLSITEGNLKAFGQSFSSAVAPEAILSDLQATTAGILQFNRDIRSLVDRGLEETAAAVAAQGPKLGGAAARAILDATPEQQAALETNFAAARNVAESEAGRLTQILGPKFKATFTEIASEGGKGGAKLGDNFVDAIRSKIPAAEAAARDLARAAKRGLDNAGSPSEHLFFDSGASFAAAAIKGFTSQLPSFTAQAAFTAQSASSSGSASTAGPVAGVPAGPVQVIVVRDGWEARQNVSAGVGQAIDGFLAGRG